MIPSRPFAEHAGVAGAATCGRETALHCAAYQGHADAMCALIIAGAI